MDGYENNEVVTVYTNLIKIMENREVKLISKQLEHNEIINILNNTEFINIKAEPNITFIQIAPNSKYANKLAEFRKLFKDFASDKLSDKLTEKQAEKQADKQTEKQRTEIMIVSDQPLTVHIANYIRQGFKIDYPNISICAHDYEKFAMDIRTHVSSGMHTICTLAEIADLEAKYMPKASFPKIPSTDTQVVWLGAKSGMLIKIKHVSETAAEYTKYRYVV